MTKKILAIALLSAAVALVGCGASEEATVTAEQGATEAAHEAKSSSAGLPAGQVEAGEKLASTKNAKTGQSCVDCHGAEGNAPIDATYPKLGGQYHDYLAHSLQGYREGKREHALMSSQAAELTDQQIADLAAYFGSRTGNLRDLHGVNN
jgi:cytochrome c553